VPLIRKEAGERTTGPSDEKSARAGIDALIQGTEEQRWSAAREATPGDIGMLARALAAEKEPRVREAIFTSLARFRNAESIEVLIAHLRSDDPTLRTGALDALVTMPDAVVPKLQSLLSDPDPDIRLLVCEVVRAMQGSDATALLCALLETEPEVNVCAAAIDVLTEIGGPEALPVLARCAKRFVGDAFLAFSIEAARDRIGSLSHNMRD
jgi:HEAT repeat protein